MIALATGFPSAEWSGSHVVLTVPSGDDTVQIALDLGQGEIAFRRIADACRDGFAARTAASAAVIDLASEKKKRGRRKA